MTTLLQEARTRVGRTQSDVARAAGTSAATLSAYEHGRVSPSLATADRVLAAMGLELAVRPRQAERVVNYGTYRGRPIDLPTELPGVPLARAFGAVTLPLHLQWSRPDQSYDLSDRTDRAMLYAIVLREGTVDDMAEWIDPHLLVDLFDDLVLPRPIRAAWRRHLTEQWDVPC